MYTITFKKGLTKDRFHRNYIILTAFDGRLRQREWFSEVSLESSSGEISYWKMFCRKSLGKGFPVDCTTPVHDRECEFDFQFKVRWNRLVLYLSWILGPDKCLNVSDKGDTSRIQVLYHSIELVLSNCSKIPLKNLDRVIRMIKRRYVANCKERSVFGSIYLTLFQRKYGQNKSWLKRVKSHNSKKMKNQVNFFLNILSKS